jgi:predicted MFS family arabinose efflux permease
MPLAVEQSAGRPKLPFVVVLPALGIVLATVVIGRFVRFASSAPTLAAALAVASFNAGIAFGL